jgi:uncharacterized protein (TIGR02453 family)
MPGVTFTGFDRNAMGFFHELSVEMSKGWFDANKDRYRELWQDPMTDLIEDVAARLAKPYKGLTLVPKVLRIHRDVRFAKDKAPYKTHIAAAVRVQDAELTAMYIHLGIEEEFVGVGTYFFDATQLAAWRKQVAGKSGEALAKLVKRLRGKGYQVGGHEDYKKVPKPHAEDHPRAEFLKMRGLTAGPKTLRRGIVHKPQFADELVLHGTALAPLVRWLHDHVG